MVLPQDLGWMLIHIYHLLTWRMGVGGQQGLERAVEEEVGPSNLDDDVESVEQPFLGPHGSPVLPPKESTYHRSPHR